MKRQVIYTSWRADDGSKIFFTSMGWLHVDHLTYLVTLGVGFGLPDGVGLVEEHGKLMADPDDIELHGGGMTLDSVPEFAPPWFLAPARQPNGWEHPPVQAYNEMLPSEIDTEPAPDPITPDGEPE